ncbi:craniofacial development protein 2 [Trichonephila clavipes]|nr:craniofacial development protein 2 [Trichonephila clavipes]
MRLCKIRLRGRHYNTTLICGHAPTDDKDETEKGLFYDLLMKSYNSCPAQDMKLVIGDFNAKIGREPFISSNAGLHSLHKETNENGQRLWDFAESENLFIISTAFPHKEIHKYTWISPDGQTHNQIDHVLIDRRHWNNIMDIRSYRGANVDTDHILVRSKVRFRLCKNFFRKRENGNYKPDTSKLMEKNILKEYKLKLSAGIISELDSSGNDFNWKSVREILKSANETVPGLERRARNEWYDEDCGKVTEMKNKAYLQLQKHCTRTHEEKYRELKKAEEKTTRKKKRNLFREFIKEPGKLQQPK